MLRKILGRAQTLYPEFKYLTIETMQRSFLNQLGNNIFYTPKIQKIRYSDELVKFMAFLSRKKTIIPEDMSLFTQNILIQYGNVYKNCRLQEEKYGFQKKYKIQQQAACPYHGTVDYMIYLNKKHFFPLMFFTNQLNPFCGVGMAMSNMIMKSKLRNEPKTSGYSLITNGQEWILYKIYRSMKIQKSLVYEAKNNRFKNIYQDYQMVSVLLGLIDYCLDVHRPDVQTLKIAYDFIDDQKFMLEAKEGEKLKESPASKVLIKHYQKKKDWDSK